MNGSKGNSSLGLIVLSVLIIIISLLTIIIKPYTYNEKGTNSTTSKSSNSLTSSTLNTSYLSISDVKVTHNSSYTVCTGKITVKSTSPYKYHFIQVKGAFKDKSGKTVDTDSTYAIGSELYYLF